MKSSTEAIVAESMNISVVVELTRISTESVAVPRISSVKRVFLLHPQERRKAAPSDMRKVEILIARNQLDQS